MLLDIIIPQFRETEEKVKVLLDSIKKQKNVDFDNIAITIVNDASDTVLSDDFLNSFDLNIRYIRNDRNTGPGLARQKGIDNTNAKFIMFADSDDEFYDEFAFFKILDFLIQYNPDYLVTNIATEVIKNNKIVLQIKKGKDTFPWMHGKVYKREFLEKNEIRFHPQVRHLEDSYFTTSVLGVVGSENVVFLDVDTYRWKLNPESLTRKKSKYHYSIETFDDFVNSPIYTYDFLCKHHCKSRFSYYASFVFGIYIMLYSDLFQYEELKDKWLYYDGILHELVDKRHNLFMLFKLDDLKKIFDNELKELVLRNNIKELKGDFDYFINNYLNHN